MNGTIKDSLIVGNAAKMREALEAIWKEVYFYIIDEEKQDFAHLQDAMLEDPPEYKVLRNRFLAIAHLVDDALAAPPRNCDIGSAAEQSKRFCAFCRPRLEPCDGCSCLEGSRHGRCEFIWAQMPYEEGGEE